MIKQLKWHTRTDDNVVFAEAKGLRWDYYIYEGEDTRNFELVLIDEHGLWEEDLVTVHDSISAAQGNAQKHYESVLRAHIEA